MAINYTPLTDFLTKDTLPKEDPDKVILGADFDAEFNAISTAFAGAAPTNNPVFTGTATFDGVTVNTVTINGLVTAGSLDIGGNATVAGTLDVTGASTFGNTVDVTGNATFGGDVAVAGTFTVDGEQLPTFDDVNSIVTNAELGPVSTLDDLSDVNVTNVSDGQTIVWDDANSEWIPLSGNLFIEVDANTVKAKSFVETHKTTTGVIYCNEGNNFTANLSSSMLVIFASVPAVDGAYACTLKITANGNPVTWPAGTVWPTATPPTLSAGTDVFVFYTHDGGTTWYGFTAGQEIG
jgi:hypothetical protein